MMPEHVMQKVHLQRESYARFMERGLAAIENTQLLGNGLSANQVMAMLDEKLRLARQMQLQSMQAKRAHFPID